MFSRWIVASLVFFSTGLLADGADESGILTGRGLRLVWKDHHLTGTVGSSTVTAAPLSGEFGVKVTHRTHGQTFTSVFRKVNGRLSGTMESRDAQGQPLQVRMEITGADPQTGLLQGQLNGRPFQVQVRASSMNGHHFVEPQLVASLGNRRYAFSMEGGQACMGCIARIAYTVVSLVSLNQLW